MTTTLDSGFAPEWRGVRSFHASRERIDATTFGDVEQRFILGDTVTLRLECDGPTAQRLYSLLRGDSAPMPEPRVVLVSRRSVELSNE